MNYKQWAWVSSVGKMPYFDSSFGLTYHWQATPKLGLDPGAKFLEYDYTMSSPTKTSSAGLRDDGQYMVSIGLSYAFTRHFSSTLGYEYQLGRNLETLPGALTVTEPYREFDRQLVTLTAQYRF